MSPYSSKPFKYALPSSPNNPVLAMKIAARLAVVGSLKKVVKSLLPVPCHNVCSLRSAHLEHVVSTCSAIYLSPPAQLQRFISALSTEWRKSFKSIFPVRICIRSAQRDLIIPLNMSMALEFWLGCMRFRYALCL